MKLKKGSEIEVQIESLVFGGRGIGSYEGRKVFVDGTAPGDRVKARLRKIKTKYMEAQLVEVLEPGSIRTEPRCKHFDTCGGCKWQFLPYEEQIKVKEQQVRDAVERLGGLDPKLVQSIVPCAEPWLYRNKMELSFGKDSEGMAMLGFYPPGYHYEVFDLEECFLQSELVSEIVKKVRDWANDQAIPVFNKETHEGLLRNLIIREGKNTDEVMVVLVTSPAEFSAVESFKALFDESITSLYWNVIHQVKGKPTWMEDQLLAGKESLTEVLNLENGQKLSFDILPQAFFQTNTKQTEKLYSMVVGAAGLTGEETLFDLYCGTGTIGLFCAHKAKQVVGVEVNAAAVESAKANAARNEITNAEFHLGTVEKNLSSLAQNPDVVIVDPPRSGLGEDVVKQTAVYQAERIVYVSCNPTTLARDLKFFAALNYETQSITPVDMFPQTAHVESICLLIKNSS